MNDDIMIVVLPDGANLICEKVERSKGVYEQETLTLHKAHLIQIQPTPEGAKLHLVPWPTFAALDGETVTVTAKNILAVTKPETRVKEGYRVEILGGVPVVQKPALVLPPGAK